MFGAIGDCSPLACFEHFLCCMLHADYIWCEWVRLCQIANIFELRKFHQILIRGESKAWTAFFCQWTLGSSSSPWTFGFGRLGSIGMARSSGSELVVDLRICCSQFRKPSWTSATTCGPFWRRQLACCEFRHWPTGTRSGLFFGSPADHFARPKSKTCASVARGDQEQFGPPNVAVLWPVVSRGFQGFQVQWGWLPWYHHNHEITTNMFIYPWVAHNASSNSQEIFAGVCQWMGQVANSLLLLGAFLILQRGYTANQAIKPAMKLLLW